MSYTCRVLRRFLEKTLGERYVTARMREDECIIDYTNVIPDDELVEELGLDPEAYWGSFQVKGERIEPSDVVINVEKYKSWEQLRRQLTEAGCEAPEEEIDALHMWGYKTGHLKLDCPKPNLPKLISLLRRLMNE